MLCVSSTARPSMTCVMALLFLAPMGTVCWMHLDCCGGVTNHPRHMTSRDSNTLKMNKINDLVVFSRWRDEDERRHSVDSVSWIVVV